MYEQEESLTMTTGKVKHWLGLKIDSNKRDKIKIDMIDYIKNVLVDIPKCMFV